MNTIADRIAGRDLDRDAAAEKLDDSLGLLALLADASLPCFRGVDDVEFLSHNTRAIHGGHPHGIWRHMWRMFPVRTPMVGRAHVACSAMDDSHGLEGRSLALSHFEPLSPAWVARRYGVPKGAVPRNTFSMASHYAGGLPLRSPVYRGGKGIYGVVGKELWRLGSEPREAGLFRAKGNKSCAWYCTARFDHETGDLETADGEWDEKDFSVGLIAAGGGSLATRRFDWGVSIGHPGMIGAFVECSPEGARALFADRNVVGGKRRTALRHWVKEHYRRGHTPEESHKVREHLRGIDRFTWHGLDVKLQVPSAEIEAAGLAVRGAS